MTTLYGKIFAEATYLLEGDQPLWSQTYEIMTELKSFLTNGPTDEQWNPMTNAAVEAATNE